MKKKSDLSKEGLIGRLGASTFLFLLLFVSVSANEPFRPLRTKAAPVIDGRLDEPLWQVAPRVSGFKTWRPDFGRALVGETEVWMAYDSENLYFAFRCYDPEPQKIKSAIKSRDNMRRDDWVCINLDSFGDQQSLSCFYINPLGIQGDSRFAAGREDQSVDFVWYSAGRIDDEGYTVEVQIPLKSIRYADRDTVVMGVIFERSVSRRSEGGTYPPLNPNIGIDSWLIQTRPIMFEGLKHYKLVELLPAFTYSERHAAQQGSLKPEEKQGEFGLTAKYGITSDLIVDGTYNPDFSQVEADAGQVDVNLRYNLFFAEKRPFFLEGSENFNLAGTQVSELDPVRSIVHTRTIVNPLAGIKLSGKIGARSTISSVYAADELSGPLTTSGTEYAHFAILRYKRALKEDSFIGGIYAGIERNGYFDRVGGIDGQIRLDESSWLGYNTLLSHAAEGRTASEEFGHELGIQYRFGTRNFDYALGLKSLADDFRADMGYVTRTGILQFTGLLKPKFYPKSEILRRVDLEFFSGQTKDRPSGLWETFNHLSLQHYLFGSLNVRLKYSYSTEIFLGRRFETGGFQLSGGGQLNKEFYMNVSYRTGNAIYYSSNPYQGHSDRLTATFTIQPSEKVQADIIFTYSNFYRDVDDQKIYDYPITRIKLTYQLNQYLFFRGVVEHNDFRRQILTDFLASFTYIPGTVIHIGYGSLYHKLRWENDRYVDSDRFLETKRGFFFKTSYLWRM